MPTHLDAATLAAVDALLDGIDEILVEEAGVETPTEIKLVKVGEDGDWVLVVQK